jgi:hypothetical protein
MSFFYDTIRDNFFVSKHDFRIAHRSIPTPTALIPGRLLVDPCFDHTTVSLFSALAKWFSDRSNNLCLCHANRDSVRRLCGCLARHEKKHAPQNQGGRFHRSSVYHRASSPRKLELSLPVDFSHYDIDAAEDDHHVGNSVTETEIFQDS